MVEHLDIRRFSPGDEGAILRLFETSFGHAMGTDYWRWRYQDNPVGGPAIELAWEGDTLAAHYAVSPVELELDGKPIKAALSMTTMTHPDYRGLGLFPKLAGRLYARLAEEGYELVFGFPNVQSHRIFARDLGWQDLAPVPMMRLELGTARLEKSAEAVEVRLAEEIACASHDAGVTLRRSAAFLSWRFEQEPEHDYRFFKSKNDAAYIVVKRFGEEMDIVDYAGSGDAAAGLISAFGVRAREEGVTAFNTWMPVFDPRFGALEKLGFVPGAPVTYMGGRSLAGAEDLFKPERWHVTMGMSDVF
ncbi:GNAT family N-acetyltransferase [Tepidicaulis sp.]|jgi:GNAT superfamily N-acetyltransferase|uniref:GNAT family N-acetyltransferase n=1 Tax=Tepidicaulis sp. TaxID=1920809 RepID=UPI003B5CAC8A